MIKPGSAVTALTWTGVMLLALTACTGSDPETATPTAAVNPESGDAATLNMADFSSAASQIQTNAIRAGGKLITACGTLQQRVHAFLEAPDVSGRDATREAYHLCYEHWNRYQVYQQLPLALKEREGFQRATQLINTRPFQPGYIDGLPEYPYSGLVHEAGMTLSLNTLLDQHRMMDAESASLGFPVIETLLWREPLPAIWLADEAEGGDNGTNPTQRRHQYLALATDDLMVRIKATTQRWRPGNAYSTLPLGAQRQVFWQSAQRLVQTRLLEDAFAIEALKDPELHHPSALAGQGRRHWLAHLEGLEAALTAGDEENSKALLAWIADLGLEPDAQALVEHLRSAQAAMESLPTNYPYEAADDANWQAARQAVAQLATDLNGYLQQLDLKMAADWGR